MKWLLAAIAIALADPARAEDAIRFPDGSSLRIKPTVDGKSPDAVWDAFLDELFDWFDRDADGTLSKAESARVIPLPSADGREVKLDASREWSRESFRAHWRSAGFKPISLRVVKPDSDAMKLGGAIAALLDRDADGKVSADELRRIPDLLKRCDENEDEVLTPSELLASIDAKAVPAAGVRVGPWPEDGPVLGLPLGGRPSFEPDSKIFRLSETGTSLALPGGSCSLRSTKEPASLRTTREFLTAQFRGITGDKPAVKAAFEDDPATQALASLFNSADRDGDGMLAPKELNAYLELVESGVNCRVLIEVEDRGRNLFDRIDANGNGSLDGAELQRASRELPNLLVDGIPFGFRISAGRGSSSSTFGSIPLGSVVNPRPDPGRSARPPSPRWFSAMDRNGDRFLSPGEFLGKPEQFSRLDLDRDGRISLEEAKLADRR